MSTPISIDPMASIPIFFRLYSIFMHRGDPKASVSYRSEGHELFLVITNLSEVSTLFNVDLSISGANGRSIPSTLIGLGLSYEDIRISPQSSFEKKICNNFRDWPEDTYISVRYRCRAKGSKRTGEPQPVSTRKLIDNSLIDSLIRTCVALAHDPRERYNLVNRIAQLEQEHAVLEDKDKWWRVENTTREYKNHSKHRSED